MILRIKLPHIIKILMNIASVAVTTWQLWFDGISVDLRKDWKIDLLSDGPI